MTKQQISKESWKHILITLNLVCKVSLHELSDYLLHD